MEKLIGNLAALKISCRAIFQQLLAKIKETLRAPDQQGVSSVLAAYFTGNLPARLFFN